ERGRSCGARRGAGAGRRRSPAMPQTALLYILLLVAVAYIVRVVRIRWMGRRNRKDDVEPIRCHGCGYDLTSLDLPRCPECGALRGFKVPLTDLGLTEEELRRSIERKRGGAPADRHA